MSSSTKTEGVTSGGAGDTIDAPKVHIAWAGETVDEVMFLGDPIVYEHSTNSAHVDMTHILLAEFVQNALAEHSDADAEFVRRAIEFRVAAQVAGSIVSIKHGADLEDWSQERRFHSLSPVALFAIAAGIDGLRSLVAEDVGRIVKDARWQLDTGSREAQS